MKIYQKVVLDIETGRIEEEDSFEYQGPMAECKGGGQTSTTTSTIDYVYNARMATLSEKQQAQADAFFKFWEEQYKPMEEAQINANMSLIGVQTEAERAKSELEKKQAEAQTGLIPKEVALKEAELGLGVQTAEARSAEIAAAKPVVSEYYKQALAGVDVNRRVGQAQATTAQAFKGSDEALSRSMGRMGITPGSGRYDEAMRNKYVEQAKATGAAMIGAREDAEEENYKRLAGASSYFKGGIA